MRLLRLAERQLGYSCRLEGILAVLSGFFVLWRGRVAEPLAVLWGAYVVLDAVVLCCMIASSASGEGDKGGNDAPAAPHPLVVSGAISGWFALLVLLVLLEFQDLLNPNKPPIVYPFVALLTGLVPVWLIPRGVMRIGAGVARKGKRRGVSLISGAFLVGIGVLAHGVPAIPRESAPVVGILVVACGFVVALLGNWLSRKEQ